MVVYLVYAVYQVIYLYNFYSTINYIIIYKNIHLKLNVKNIYIHLPTDLGVNYIFEDPQWNGDFFWFVWVDSRKTFDVNLQCPVMIKNAFMLYMNNYCFKRSIDTYVGKL